MRLGFSLDTLCSPVVHVCFSQVEYEVSHHVSTAAIPLLLHQCRSPVPSGACREFKECLAAIRSSRPRPAVAPAAPITASLAAAAATAASPVPIPPSPPPSIHHWNQRRCPRALPSTRSLFPAITSTSAAAAAAGKGNGGEGRKKGRGDATAAAGGWAAAGENRIAEHKSATPRIAPHGNTLGRQLLAGTSKTPREGSGSATTPRCGL